MGRRARRSAVVGGSGASLCAWMTRPPYRRRRGLSTIMGYSHVRPLRKQKGAPVARFLSVFLAPSEVTAWFLNLGSVLYPPPQAPPAALPSPHPQLTHNLSPSHPSPPLPSPARPLPRLRGSRATACTRQARRRHYLAWAHYSRHGGQSVLSGRAAEGVQGRGGDRGRG